MKEFFGEVLGTFLLVLFGCGAIAVAVLFNGYQSLLQLALIWGGAVTLAVFATRHLSCAHLNPAVSIAMVIAGRMKARHLPTYIVAQLLGAILAGLMVYVLFSPSIEAFEAANGIVRGDPQSVLSAKMFGDYYLPPITPATVSMPLAMLAEGFGVFLLVVMIFALTEGCNVGRPDSGLAPVFIGLTVTSIVCLVGFLSMSSLNPARDFGPRMVAWAMGWGQAAFPDANGGFFWVYILSPILGGGAAAFFFKYVLEPVMKMKGGCPNDCDCDKSDAA